MPRKSILKKDMQATKEREMKSVKFNTARVSEYSNDPTSRHSTASVEIPEVDRKVEVLYIKVLESFYVDVVRENNNMKDRSISSVNG